MDKELLKGVQFDKKGYCHLYLVTALVSGLSLCPVGAAAAFKLKSKNTKDSFIICRASLFELNME